jgi:prepilin-type N-terminal cleavage/methylation domain-containing protein
MRYAAKNSTLRKFAQTGFTLMELLIVVVILAILAAIVMPQFSSSGIDAREAALDTNLGVLRTAIQLYRGQHGVYPGAVTAVSAACAPGTTGTGIAAGGAGTTASQAFIDQLVLFSNAAGGTCDVNTGLAFNLGPYLRGGIPNDPITGLGSAVANITTTAAGTALAAGGTAGGWLYDTVSGQIVMNSNALDSRNNAYWTH